MQSVYFVFCAAGCEEVGNLAGGCYAGVEVGLGCLGTALLGGEEYAVGKAFEEHVGIAGAHVGKVLEVGSLGEYFFELGLVDDLLAGGVDEHCAFGHGGDEFAAYAALGLSSGRYVNRHKVVAAIEGFEERGRQPRRPR